MKRVYFSLILKYAIVVFLVIRVTCPALSQTELKGTITRDTVLSLSGSPYTVTASLYVRNNATLTILPGTVVEVKSYNITIGSTTPGKLIAAGVDFKNTSTTERNIVIKDGSDCSFENCSFNRIHVRIEENAGELRKFVSNKFYNVSYPIISSPVKLPEVSGEVGTISTLGIFGYVNSDAILPQKSFPYTLTGTINIRNGATLHIAEGAELDFNQYTLNIGSTSPGYLQATNVRLFSSKTTEKYILFRDGSGGEILNCQLEKVYISIDDDASDELRIQSNRFTSVSYPVILSVGRTPAISGNICNNPVIGLKGTLKKDGFLPKYEWVYKLWSSVIVQNNAQLSIAEQVSISLNHYTLRIGYGTAGFIDARNVFFVNTTNAEKYIDFKNGGGGNLRDCQFEFVAVRIEDTAGDDLFIGNNNFARSAFPIIISASRRPDISNNISDNEVIGLYGNVIQNNTLKRYEWDYQLTGNVTVRQNITLKIPAGLTIDLRHYELFVGYSVSAPSYLESTGVHFKGEGNNKGVIRFLYNSAGDITDCSFEQCYLRINNSSPKFTRCRFYRSRTAVEIGGTSMPVFHNCDFYNNETALSYAGTGNLDAAGNYWGHLSGPQHTSNPEGVGDVISGSITVLPYLNSPATGFVSGECIPSEFRLGSISTGALINNSFSIWNTGTIDLLVLGLKSHTSNISVQCPDRFWIFPDSTRIIPFTFSSLDDKIQSDTLVLLTNDNQQPEYVITLMAQGRIDSLLMHFYKVDVDSFPNVKAHVTITDQSGIPLSNITKPMFTVYEEGQIISDFELLTKAMSSDSLAVTLVIDRSGSMAGQPLRDAKNAATDLIGRMANNDVASVIGFGSSANLEASFTSDKQHLASVVDLIQSAGSTALYNAIMMGIQESKANPRHRVIVALTDGRDNASSFSPMDIVEQALQYEITIYTIGLGNDIDESTLRYMAITTGGQYFHAPTSAMLAYIYRIISGHLQSNYIISYLAPDVGPTFRLLKAELDYNGLSAADSVLYLTESQVVEFVPESGPFCQDKFYKNSKAYFYYKVNDPDSKLLKGQRFSFIQDRSILILCEGEYLGDGLMQFGVDLYDNIPISTLWFEFPDSIRYNGNYIKFVNKPKGFSKPVFRPNFSESIDVFAGISQEIKLLAGGVGAGPSIAAASVGLGASQGMGLNFEMNTEHEQEITRRFEAGIGLKVESPAINSTVGDVQAGVKSGITVSGLLGQTMKFPVNMSSNQRKAKALYLLETFSLGAFSLSPDCSLLKQALFLSLSSLSGGITNAYKSMYLSEEYGISLEGTASLGASYALGSGSDQNKFTLAEAGIGMTASALFTDFSNSSDMAMEFGYAISGGFSLLNIEALGLDLGSVYGYTCGSKISLGADFNPTQKLTSLKLSFTLDETQNVLFDKLYKSKEFGFTVPSSVITRTLNKNNLVSAVAPFFDSSAPKFDFRIGKDYFISAVDTLFKYASGPLSTLDQHIMIETGKSEAICAELGASVEIAAAALIGGSLELGLTFGVIRETTVEENAYTIAENKLLPMAKYHTPVKSGGIMSLKDEVEFLFENVPGLVMDLLNSLLSKIGGAIEAGVDFLLDTSDGACSLGGQIVSAGEDILTQGFAEIVSFKPQLPVVNPFKSAFLDPDVVYGYLSRSIDTGLDDGPETGTQPDKVLCIVSDFYKIRILNQDGTLVKEFEPLSLKIGIDNELFRQYGFTDNEKALLSMYQYDFEALTWRLISGDKHTSTDTVMCEIVGCGTYAIGVLVDRSLDDTAPVILGHYPAEGGIYRTDSIFWAKLYESTLGSGINLAAVSMAIDDVAVDALWNPVTQVLSYLPSSPLTPGVHSLNIYAVDNNGNAAEKTIPFTVITTESEEINVRTDDPVIVCYPNPANSLLIIRIENACLHKDYQIRIYNLFGQQVAEVFNGRVYENSFEVTWNLTSAQSARVAPGVYFVRFRSGEKLLLKKVILN